MMRIVLNFARDDEGVTPVEYALIVAIITVAATAVASAAGYSLVDLIG